MRRASRPARDAPPVGDAYDEAVRYLGSRPRSVAEIKRHLATKRFDDAAQEKAIDALRAQRYIDDEAFARYWVEQRARFRPKGARAIVSELMAKGVARETIDVVLGEADPNAETRRAREVIRRPMARWLSMDERERKRKIHQYLVTRGFTYDVIEEVIAKPEADDE
jgi:regulatory protein